MPSICGITGRAPVAIRILSAVTSLPLASLTEFGPGQLRALVEDLDVVVGQRLGVGALEPADLGQHIVAQHRPVEALLRHVPAEHRRIVEVLGEMRAVDEQLLGHAAADHAGAADLIFLGDRDPGAMRRGDARGAHAARPGADHEQVEVGHQTPALSISARVDASSVVLVRAVGKLPRDLLAELDPELVERVDPSSTALAKVRCS